MWPRGTYVQSFRSIALAVTKRAMFTDDNDDGQHVIVKAHLRWAKKAQEPTQKNTPHSKMSFAYVLSMYLRTISIAIGDRWFTTQTMHLHQKINFCAFVQDICGNIQFHMTEDRSGLYTCFLLLETWYPCQSLVPDFSQWFFTFVDSIWNGLWKIAFWLSKRLGNRMLWNNSSKIKRWRRNCLLSKYIAANLQEESLVRFSISFKIFRSFETPISKMRHWQFWRKFPTVHCHAMNAEAGHNTVGALLFLLSAPYTSVLYYGARKRS
jgi:hypothetical protein